MKKTLPRRRQPQKDYRGVREGEVDDPAERAKPEKQVAKRRLLIVCDMLLTGFDGPIVETMYLDKDIRDQTVREATRCATGVTARERAVLEDLGFRKPASEFMSAVCNRRIRPNIKAAG